MRLQVLVSTMHQKDYSLLDRMNISSDAIIINQCDRNEFVELKHRGKDVRFLSLNERGIGLSRNTALMRADADVVLFADDDVVYSNGYEDSILREFKESEADLVFFNMRCVTPGKSNRVIRKKQRIRFFNALHYGAVRIAVKLESVRNANVFFSLLFGGGAKYSAGEDSLFICDCLRKGLRMYASPSYIGEVSHEQSTWFNGFNDKYFFDKGVLFSHISKRGAFLLCLQFALRHQKMFRNEKSWIEAYRLMLQGVRGSENYPGSL